MLNANKKVALVTGSGRGMGRAIALKLSQEHITVVINDLNRDLAESTQELIRHSGGICSLSIGDASDEEIAAG